MTDVECLAVRWVSDDQPGFVEVELTDAVGAIWRLVDKVSVFGDPSLTPEGPYPRRVLVACEVVGEGQDDRVEVVLRHGVEAVDGTARLWVRLPAVHSGLLGWRRFAVRMQSRRRRLRAAWLAHASPTVIWTASGRWSRQEGDLPAPRSTPPREAAHFDHPLVQMTPQT